jgi:type IV pilus assembly protein PilA
MRPRRVPQQGFSLIELLIVVAIILILATIAVPKLNQNRMHAQETAAIKQIGTIHAAMTQYYSQFGRFPTSLQELGPAQGGNPGPQAADLIPGDLAAGKKSGYIFEVRPTASGYEVLARPEVYGSTGRRAFYSDQTLVIRENWGPTAGPDSKEIGSSQEATSKQ